MSKFFLTLLFALLIPQVSFSSEKPSPEIIKEFLLVTNAHQNFEMMLQPMNKVMDNQLEIFYKQLRVKFSTNEQNEIIKKNFMEINNYVNSQISWEKQEPNIVIAYQEELTQKELEEAVAFYKTDSGQAILKKVPNIFKRITEAQSSVQGNIKEYVTKSLIQLSKELDDTNAHKK